MNKAVIPAAGLGTRFLPATKSQPKEMLPVVDKPSIQYVVEEAVRAGLTDILIITGRGKRAIEDHFDRNFELEHYLEQTGKDDLLKEVQERQRPRRHPLHPPARPARSRPRGRRSRASTSATSRSRCCSATTSWSTTRALLRSMLDVHERYGRSVLALHGGAARARSPSYGCVEPGEVEDEPRARCSRSSRSRRREDAPSNLAVIGRYVFTPEIFDALDRIEPGAGGELQLTDAIALLLETQTVYGRVFTRRPLRHRPEDRLPAGQHRARARPARPRPRARADPRRARAREPRLVGAAYRRT